MEKTEPIVRFKINTKIVENQDNFENKLTNMRPTATNIGANVPAFLSKLWKMVNDPETDQLISWSPGGHSFIIQNEAQFWYNLLPIYYKHNNMSSFIRQLNMYGFHKISSENGGMDCDKDEIKFFHPFFQQDQPNLIKHIKRKIASSKSSTTTAEDNKVNSVDEITRVLVDVKQLRGRQESVDNQLLAMKQENAALWRELALLRQKHMKQQQIVNKLIQFLVTIVQPARGGLGGLGVKRRYPLMLNNTRYSKQSKKELSSDGPTIHELDAETALTDSLLLSDESTSSDIRASPADDKEKMENLSSPQKSVMDTSNKLLDVGDTGNNTDQPPDEPEGFTLPDQLVNSGNENTSRNESNTVADLFTDTRLPEPVSRNEEFPLPETDLQQVINNKDLLQAANEYIDLNALNALDDTKSSKPSMTSNAKDAMFSHPVVESFQTDKPDTVNQQPFENEEKKSDIDSKNKLTVATRSNTNDLSKFKVNSNDVFFSDDLDSHLETTQDELDSIKDMLFDGYSLDANALLGNEVNDRFDGPLQLFNPDENFPVDVPPQLALPEETKECGEGNYGDPLMSGSELMTYNNTPFLLDFDNLFEDSSDTAAPVAETAQSNDNNQFTLVDTSTDDQITTPITIKKEPSFPTTTKPNSTK
ncbi:Heat shock factor [Carabus blaptoides fortunei]